MEAERVSEAAPIEDLIALPSRKAAKAATDLPPSGGVKPVGDTGQMSIPVTGRCHRRTRLRDRVLILLLSTGKSETISMLLPNRDLRGITAPESAEEGVNRLVSSFRKEAEPVDPKPEAGAAREELL